MPSQRGNGSSPRLDAVAALVLSGGVAADIGTDHGRLARMLVASGRVRRCIASERGAARLANFRALSPRHELAGRLELRVGDGLDVLRPDDHVRTVVLAGLGARTIVSLLERGGLARLGVRRLVLQPQTEPQLVRRWVVAHGHAIADERIAREADRFYELLAAEPDPGATLPRHPLLPPEDLLQAGPRLVERRDPLLAEMWSRRLARLEEVGRGARGERPSLRARILQARRILAVCELPSGA
jgi:tRNA (adenine22-N1)-methyltransferase